MGKFNDKLCDLLKQTDYLHNEMQKFLVNSIGKNVIRIWKDGGYNAGVFVFDKVLGAHQEKYIYALAVFDNKLCCLPYDYTYESMTNEELLECDGWRIVERQEYAATIERIAFYFIYYYVEL